MKEKKEESFTPMVEQYLSFKKQYGDIILFFRIGDFYEMFLSDAELCSKELQLYLTSKSCGNGKKIPMCGIPHRSYLSYAQKLIDRGYKVAICEQVEDPKLTKKLVKRDVIQIISPGANLDLNTKSSNYIGSLGLYPNIAVLSYADVTTGEMFCLNLDPEKEKILEELLFLDIKELVVPTSLDSDLIVYLKKNCQIPLSYYNDSSSTLELENLFVNLKDERQVETSARLYNYLSNMERRSLSYFKPVVNQMGEKRMRIDYSAQSNMELVKSLEGKSFGTLFWLLDKTKTPMGSRYLKNRLTSPMADEKRIQESLDLTECFVKDYRSREKLREDLSEIFDMERLIARMGYENCNGHDLLQLKRSLQVLPEIEKDLRKMEKIPPLEKLLSELGNYDELTSLLEKAIREDCPLTISEGEIFKKGYDQQLDELIDLTSDAKDWIARLEEKEKERTGIKTLKVGYNTVFGYYIEVSAGQVKEVKDEYGYIRKQTLKTGERYITAELKEKEDRILRAKDEKMSLEYKLFKELRKKVSQFTQDIQKTSNAIAMLDYYLALAFVASEQGYVRPTFTRDGRIDITDARHPIIEVASPQTLFVSNDYHMDSSTDVLIITGPNMGGKSTYMKEFGLIAILAQIGSFVPAKSCAIPIFDALYTRIGASDNLIKGQSTFMTEMSEVAQALSTATSQSLLLFDEIGRGTATYDGMAIAESIIEHIVKHIRAKTFFSTHYHEITTLSQKIPSVKNIHCEVEDVNGEITFLYKMKEGSMDRSYGIHVARLAGLPEECIERADELLHSFESQDHVQKDQIKTVVPVEKEKDEIRDMLKDMDPMKMTPLEALNYLFELKKKVK